MRIAERLNKYLFPKLTGRPYLGQLYLRAISTLGRLPDVTPDVQRRCNVLAALPRVWQGHREYRQLFLPPEHPLSLVNLRSLLEYYDTFLFDVFGTLKINMEFPWGGIKFVRKVL